jgi:hypothetical protein
MLGLIRPAGRQCGSPLDLMWSVCARSRVLGVLTVQSLYHAEILYLNPAEPVTVETGAAREGQVLPVGRKWQRVHQLAAERGPEPRREPRGLPDRRKCRADAGSRMWASEGWMSGMTKSAERLGDGLTGTSVPAESEFRQDHFLMA